MFVTRWIKRRRNRRVTELNYYPQTPAEFYTGFYPASAPIKTSRSQFKIQNQKTPELNDYPYTPIGYYSGYYPGSKLAEGNQFDFNIGRCDVLELNNYPATPAGYYSGFYPGSKLAEATRYDFNIVARAVLELNEYPETPDVSEQPLTAWISRPVKRNRYQIQVKTTGHDVYPETPFSYYSGYYPGSKAVSAFNFNYEIKALSVPLHDVYPATPVVQPITAWLPSFNKTKNYTNRQALFLNLDSYPPTPIGYYSGFYPGSALVASFRYSFKRQHLNVTLSEFPSTPAPAAPALPGLEYTIRISKLHYSIDGQLHYISSGRIGYTLDFDD